MTPRVSICIRATRPEHLPQAIESALGQSFADLEVVVLDDVGGLEESAFRSGDPRVRYVRSPYAPGSTNALRAAFGAARGELIGALDDDDLLLPAYLATVVARFDAEPELDVVFTNHYIDRGRRVTPRRRLLEPGTYASFLPVLLRCQPVPMSAALLRREVWEEAGPMSPPVREDALLWLRAAAAGRRFHYVDEPLTVYRVHPGQLSARLDSRLRSLGTWTAVSFDDPACERLRLQYVCEAHTDLAALALQEGRHEDALAELARAREADPGAARARRSVLGSLARHPALVPAAAGTWRAVRRVRPYRAAWAR